MYIFSNPQMEILVSFSRSTNVNVNMYYPNSNFEENFSTYVFAKSFGHYRELKRECWTSRHILCKKILNIFICVEVRILCKKSEICMKLTFSPRPLHQTCRLETTLLFLNTRLLLNKKFQNSQ